MPKGGSTTVEQKIDPQTQAYVDQLRKAAQAAAPGYQPYQQAGQQGLQALTGGPNAFMNPYQQQFNAPGGIFDTIRQQTLGAVGDQATQAGAFGGSRHGVAEGEALAGLGRNQAAFNYGAFNDAQQRAMQAANLGFGAVGAPSQLMGGAIGPYGQTQTTTQHTDPWSQLLGLGLTIGGYALGGPVGGAVGSKLGGGLGGAPTPGGWMGDAGYGDNGDLGGPGFWGGYGS